MDNPLVPIIIVQGVVLLGIIIKAVWDLIFHKMNNKVAHKQVSVSETEAQTHQFQAIIDGFTQSLAVVSNRATTAEESARHATEEAKRANARADELEQRLDESEARELQMLDHLKAVEDLVPNPPGPPARPAWLKK